MTGHRVLVSAWIGLTLLGGLNHTIAEKLIGRRFDLLLPNLKYGHVMFNTNPRVVHTYEYAGSDGVRHDLVDLVEVKALGYAHARLGISLLLKPDTLKDLCFRAYRQRKQELKFIVHEYDIDVDAGASHPRDPRVPRKTDTLTCGAYGLSDR